MKLSRHRHTSCLSPAAAARVAFLRTITTALSAITLALLGQTRLEAAESKSPSTEAGGKTDGGTQVLKWKDGKKACFMIAFDDSAPSQLKNVVPELEKRKIVGNFYLVTGNSLWANLRTMW